MAEVCSSTLATGGSLKCQLTAAECGAETEAAANGVDGGLESLGGPICAICLDCVPEVDTALIKGCEHTYCVMCILKWACSKETAACPQCKSPLDYLYVHRQLDGSISDYLLPESVCLLKRAPWFTEHMELLAKGPKISSAAAGQYPDDYFDDDYEDDEDLEEMLATRYLNASQRRVIIGNRRFGEHGQVRSGRMYARPVAQAAANSSNSATRKGGIGKAWKGTQQVDDGIGQSSNCAAGSSSSGSSSTAVAGSSSTSRTVNSMPGCAASNSGPSTAAAVRIINSNATVARQGAGGAESSSTSTVIVAGTAQASPQTSGAAATHAATSSTAATASAANSANLLPGQNRGASGNNAAKNGGKAAAKGAAGAGSSSTLPAGAGSAGGAAGSSAGKPATGRRAKRAQRRAAADLNWDDDDYGYY